MPAMPFLNSMAMNGKAVHWRYVKIVSQDLLAAVLEAVVALEVAWVVDVEVSVVGAATVVVDPLLVVMGVVAVAMEVVMVALPLEALRPLVLQVPSLHQTLSPTLLLREVNGTRSSMSEM